MKKKIATLLLAIAVTGLSCSGTRNNKETPVQDQTNMLPVKAPEFDADSAYQYVKAQVDFGPRVPNTKEHRACGEYLAARLASHGAQVTDQFVDLVAYDGTLLKARNIIGSYQPENKRRVALFAHWDSRPWADNDPDKSKHHTPILGANDGASGVGVLLEIARLIRQQEPSVGVDIILVDAEDYGAPQFYQGEHKEEYWCLGSQYWARYPHVTGYNARFGILLDMVGGKGATFYQEGFSNEYARSVVKKVWDKAHQLGYGNYFIREKGGYVTDDHLFINRIARIPTIDIVPNDETSELSSFGSFWHTQNDNMDVIDRSTLKAVGQTVLEVIYNEK